MPQKIAVAVVHGIGDSRSKAKQNQVKETGFLIPFKQHLFKQFKRLGLSAQDVNSKFEFIAVYWTPVLQVSQDKLWNRLKRGNQNYFTHSSVNGYLPKALIYLWERVN